METYVTSEFSALVLWVSAILLGHLAGSSKNLLCLKSVLVHTSLLSGHLSLNLCLDISVIMLAFKPPADFNSLLNLFKDQKAR